MSRAEQVRARLQQDLAELAAAHGVPGAQAAVLVDGEIAEAATGVLNLGTGVEATTDSLFQTGSIGKLWTSTLVMQLVDDGLLDLDRPVRAYLPEFVLAEEQAAATITTRQLLAHTAGFAGDLFPDTGNGADALAKFTATLHDARQLFTPGERFSYNNAGFNTLGRLVEVLRGAEFNQVMRERLIAPLGLTHTSIGAAEAIRYRAALGHLPGPDGEQMPAPVWNLPNSAAPSGSLLATRAAELLAFARVFLDGGREGVLSAASVKAVLAAHSEVPPVGFLPPHYGLGWGLWDLEGPVVIGHDGGTIGQSAFLRVVPEAGVAVALFTNGGDTARLYQELVVPLLAELAGATLPVLPVPPAEPVAVDPARVVGSYDAIMAIYHLSVDDEGRFWLVQEPVTELAKLAPHADGPRELVGLNADALISKEPERGVHTVLVPVGEPGQPARFLHSGGRAAVRL